MSCAGLAMALPLVVRRAAQEMRESMLRGSQVNDAAKSMIVLFGLCCYTDELCRQPQMS